MASPIGSAVDPGDGPLGGGCWPGLQAAAARSTPAAIRPAWPSACSRLPPLPARAIAGTAATAKPQAASFDGSGSAKPLQCEGEAGQPGVPQACRCGSTLAGWPSEPEQSRARIPEIHRSAWWVNGIEGRAKDALAPRAMRCRLWMPTSTPLPAAGGDAAGCALEDAHLIVAQQRAGRADRAPSPGATATAPWLNGLLPPLPERLRDRR